MGKKESEKEKKLPQITKQASSFFSLIGKAKMSLITRISFLAEPSGMAKPGPACVERMPLGLPVARILSPQKRALGGISGLHGVAKGACNPVYGYGANLFCLPLWESKGTLTLKLILPMAATLWLVCVTRWINSQHLFPSVHSLLCYHVLYYCLLTAPVTTANSYHSSERLAGKRLPALLFREPLSHYLWVSYGSFLHFRAIKTFYKEISWGKHWVNFKQKSSAFLTFSAAMRSKAYNLMNESNVSCVQWIYS